MKYIFVFFLAVLPACIFAQQNNTFDIEKLTPPKSALLTTTPASLFDALKVDAEANAPLPNELVFMDEHPFLSGILAAYKQHRPFVISPDIIWLLINQGFARHVFNNSDTLRNALVNFKGRKELIVVTRDIQLGDKKSNWAALFPQFIEQTNDYTSKELTDILTADFSTSTLTTKIVSQITIMEGLKAYFNYKVIMGACGIPKITIEGTVADWEKVLAKTRYLSRYQLEWWTKELEPILQKIIDAKKGNFDKDFWINMVKAHTETTYGSPTTIDGWITKFFPYTKEGKKTDLKPITRINDLASEIVKVPFVLQDQRNNKTYKMEFWAGFFGLSQNEKDYTLKPEIGWVVNNKTKFNPEKSEFRYMETVDNLSLDNVIALPPDLFLLKEIDILHISFEGDIEIPDELSKIEIGTLDLHGHITEEGKADIKRLFPDTKITINGQQQ